MMTEFANSGDETLKSMMMVMSIESLKKIHEAVSNNNNPEHRYRTLGKQIFHDMQTHINNFKEASNAIEETMATMSEIFLVAGYMTDGGGMDWKKYMSDAMTTIMHKSMEAGGAAVAGHA